MDVVAIAWDLMHVDSSHCQLVNGVEMILFLAWTIVKDILIIEKRYPNLWGNSNSRFDDNTITAEAKYFVNTSKSRKKICLILHFNTAKSFL